MVKLSFSGLPLDVSYFSLRQYSLGKSDVQKNSGPVVLAFSRKSNFGLPSGVLCSLKPRSSGEMSSLNLGVSCSRRISERVEKYLSGRFKTNYTTKGLNKLFPKEKEREMSWYNYDFVRELFVKGSQTTHCP